MKHFKKWMGLVVVLIFGVRLWYSLSIPGFSSDQSYFHVRQVESILTTGLPFWQDTLAWGGRHITFSPVYDYLLAGFAYAFGTSTGLKIAAELITALLSLITALLVFKLTKNQVTALFAAVLLAIVPALTEHTLNQLWPQSLTILLITLALFFFDAIHAYWIVPLAAITHPVSLVWIAITLGILFLSWLRQIKKYDLVKTFITSILVASINLGFWLPDLKQYGLSTITGNIPLILRSELSGIPSVLATMTAIGIIPVVCATITAYNELFNSREKYLATAISLSLVCAAIIMSPLGPRADIIILLAIGTITLFSVWAVHTLVYIRTTRLGKHIRILACAALIFIIITTAWPLPTIVKQVRNIFPYKDQLMLQWLEERTPVNATVLALATDGQRIAAVSQRKTVLDTTFTSRTDATTRAKDIQRLYQTSIELEAVQILDKYHADYIYFSTSAAIKYGPTLTSAAEKGCFTLIYDLGPKIYEKSEECKSHTK